MFVGGESALLIGQNLRAGLGRRRTLLSPPEWLYKHLRLDKDAHTGERTKTHMKEGAHALFARVWLTPKTANALPDQDYWVPGRMMENSASACAHSDGCP
jgi:hypothetical protein